MAQGGPDNLQIPVQCTDTVPENTIPTPTVPVPLRENRPGKSWIQVELDATKQFVSVESRQRLAQVGQLAIQVDDLQKQEESIRSELIKLQSRLDDIQKSSSSVQNTDLLKHLATVKSEAEEGKSRFEKRIELLERRIESVERSFTEEGLGQKLQKLQAESKRIENDVREDFKRGLEDLKQQILQRLSLFSGSTPELEPAAMTTAEEDRLAPIAGSETEVVVRRRKQVVTNVDLASTSPSGDPIASTLPDNSSSSTITDVKRASRASSGYYSVSSSRPNSIARSDSNVSLGTHRLSQFSLEELKEEDDDPDQKNDDNAN